jgi:hypothetical protein
LKAVTGFPAFFAGSNFILCAASIQLSFSPNGKPLTTEICRFYPFPKIESAKLQFLERKLFLFLV